MEALLSFIAAATLQSHMPSAHVVGQDKIHSLLFGKGITEEVLDGSVQPKLKSVHTNAATGEFYKTNYDANYDNLITHCQQALIYWGYSDFTDKCGIPTTGRTRK